MHDLVSLVSTACIHTIFSLDSHAEANMQDPVTATPAVLVKQYNITQHKELEAQLSLRHGDLQRCA